jgi:nucleotidyltransferase/DNA polymerase involved in DNA repair
MGQYKIEEIEGIGPAYGEKLRAEGISHTGQLLEQTSTPSLRKQLAEKTGISDKLVLAFANKADLLRVKGVGSEFSDLLEAAGVDTVAELARRNADNLTQKMGEVNDEKKLCRRAPNLTEVSAWIEYAKELPRVLEY